MITTTTSNTIPSSNKGAPKSGMSEQDIFKTVLKHSLFIILSPIATFFFSKLYIFDAIFNLDSMYSNLYSAFVAVIFLHIALGNFIYQAYFYSEAVPGFDKLEKED